MKIFYQITLCLAVAVSTFTFSTVTTENASAAPQTKLTSFFQGSNACDSGCDATCDGSGGGVLGGGGILGCLGKNRSSNVCCPDCNNCFPEEYCRLKVEMGEREFTCFEVDYKTICVPKVTFPWQKRKCGSCGNLGGCDGACDGSTAACDGGGCDSTGNGCDGVGCNGNGCGRGCGLGSGCRICQNKKEGCCPPACIDIPCNPCAKAKSVKVLKTKKYKCPQCKCKWEVVKPELPATPNAAPAPQPTPVHPAASVKPFENQNLQAPISPASSKKSNGYFGDMKPLFKRIPQLTASKPKDYSTEFSLSDSDEKKSSWSVGDLLRRR